MLTEYVIYLLGGVAAGFMAGLFGLGGGIIVVPILYFLFSHDTLFAPDVIMHMAAGTSLAVMIFTASSSTYAFYRRRLILAPLFYRFTPGMIVGLFIGSLCASLLPGNKLHIAFGVFVMLVAIQLFFSKTPKTSRTLPHPFIITGMASCVGLLAGFFGVSGGTLMVPFFVYSGIEMHKATATSAACGLPLAIIGTATFIVMGWSTMLIQQPPLGTTGYVYWPAALMMACTSLVCAPLGTKVAAGMSGRLLKRVFSAVLVATAIHIFIV